MSNSEISTGTQKYICFTNVSAFSYSMSSTGKESMNAATWLNGSSSPVHQSELSVLKLHESSHLLSYTSLSSILHLTLKFGFLLKLTR